MNLLQAIIMGIVQGLSEFLPISSSAHLVFASNLYKHFTGINANIGNNQEVFLDIMLHLGTLIAVMIFFKKEISEILIALYNGIKNKNHTDENFKTGLYIILGTILTIIVAYPLSSIAQRLVFMPQITGIILVITGILLITSELWNKKYKETKGMDFKSSIIVGIAQGLASLPGFSRSGLTIASALFMGQERNKAARYSFLLSIPVILGASMLYPLIKLDFSEIITYNWLAIIAGTIVSGFVGYFCIKYFLKFVSKFTLCGFGYYCIIVGTAFAIFFSLI